MPLPIPAIGLGLDVAQSIVNPILQNATNQRNREFTKEMYSRQRADALSDWNMQNEYNSPQQTMARLKAAGLNPNLIYGGATAGNAGEPRGSSVSAGQAKAPELPGNIGQSLLAYQDFQQKELNQDRTAQAMEIGDIQKELLQAQVVKTLADAASTETGTGMKISMFPTNLELAQKRLEQMQAGNALKWQQLEQSEKQFPAQLAALFLKNKMTEEQIKNQPIIRQKLQQDIAASMSQQTLTELKQLSEQQKQTLFDDIQQSQVWRNKLYGLQVNEKEQQVELNKIKMKFRSMGLSETATSDLIKSIIGIRVTRAR